MRLKPIAGNLQKLTDKTTMTLRNVMLVAYSVQVLLPTFLVPFRRCHIENRHTVAGFMFTKERCRELDQEKKGQNE